MTPTVASAALDPNASQMRVVRGACPHDCPDTCAMLVTVEAGRAVRVTGDPEHPFTRGFLCAKVNRYIERTYHEDRLLHPMRRVDPKGSGKFARISWDDALDEIAERLNAIRNSRDGPQSILPYSYAGTMGVVQGQSIDRRFFHLIGASMLDRTICSTPGKIGMQMTVGANVGADPEGIPQSDMVLLWGTNTLTSNPHMWPFVLEAKARGAPIIAIDPIRTRTAAQCDEWIGLRPGTDAALALGMMHVVLERGLQDDDYIARYTTGIDALRERAREYTPEHTARITGVAPEVIVSLGERYGRAKAAFIRVNYGLQRHGGGGMAVRTIACLPALTGHWRRAGGGVQLSSSQNYKFNTALVERPDFSPPVRTINMIRLGEALTTKDGGVGGPPVRALIVYNSNPAAVAPDRNAVLEGMRREDLFTVVLEHFQTDTADYADIVLPATTQLEHWDLHLSYGHHYVTLNQPSIEPLGESLPNSEIFRRIAARMGLDHPSLRDDDLTLIRQALDSTHEKMQGVSLETLMERGWTRLNVPTPYMPYEKGGFATPSGKCEFHSPRLEQMGIDPVPTFTAPYEFPESVPELAERYPLTLISSPAHQFLNSTFVNIGALRRGAREPECLLHPVDAEERGIGVGARVVVHNDRGAFTAVARVEDSIRPGVVWAPSIWWGKFAADGANANQTTSQRETDLGRGPVFYDNLVEVGLAD
ncbi:MAG TPA: molybdopterin oxidoreductase family protein [Gemmatimonadaceae bacterium]|jgi:anaerobic selenocysteine-containing dehydrogenase|nr:molybdopterin oxidoreductase family protein [Gemmatimonadaceae bacterium]